MKQKKWCFEAASIVFEAAKIEPEAAIDIFRADSKIFRTTPGV